MWRSRLAVGLVLGLTAVSRWSSAPPAEELPAAAAELASSGWSRGAGAMSSGMSATPSRHVVWESEGLVAYLNPRPWTPGSVILESGRAGRLGGSLFHLEEPEYVSWLMGARRVAELLCDKLKVRRCALVSRPHAHTPIQIRILPLHGLDEEWRPHLAGEEEYHGRDPGFCTSKTAPRWSESALKEIQTRIRSQLPVPDAPPNLTFLGEDASHPGLFSRIVRGEEPQWRLWDDAGHVSFLTPFPNSPGFTVVVPRRPLTSDIFGLEEEDYRELVVAVQKVSLLLEAGLSARGVGLIFEGFEIDYAHAKLIPLIPAEHSQEPAPAPARFHPVYPGYVSSQDGPEASRDSLRQLHATIVGIPQ